MINYLLCDHRQLIVYQFIAYTSHFDDASKVSASHRTIDDEKTLSNT